MVWGRGGGFRGGRSIEEGGAGEGMWMEIEGGKGAGGEEKEKKTDDTHV